MLVYARGLQDAWNKFAEAKFAGFRPPAEQYRVVETVDMGDDENPHRYIFRKIVTLTKEHKEMIQFIFKGLYDANGAKDQRFAEQNWANPKTGQFGSGVYGGFAFAEQAWFYTVFGRSEETDILLNQDYCRLSDAVQQIISWAEYGEDFIVLI